MAVSIITQVISLPLPPTEKLVLIAIADFSNDGGTCFPGRKAIAEKASLSLSTVDRCLKKLVDGGWLMFEKRHSKRGDFTSSLYSINLEKVMGGSVTVTPPLASERRHPSVTVTPPSLTCHLTKDRKPAQKTPAAPGKLSRHAWFTKWWCYSFEQITEHRYSYSKKAAGIIRNLLKDLDLEEVTARACTYLSLPEADRFPKGAPTLEGLASMVNQLAGKCDADLEDRFFRGGMLPDFDVRLIDFRPWEVPAQFREDNRKAASA